MSHIKENVCVILNIFYKFLAKLLAQNVTSLIRHKIFHTLPNFVSANLPAVSLKHNRQGFVFLIYTSS